AGDGIRYFHVTGVQTCALPIYDTEQIFYVLEGHGTLTIGKDDQQQHDVQPGDVVRIPVSTWHSIQANAGQTLRYLAIDCFGDKRSEERRGGKECSTGDSPRQQR